MKDLETLDYRFIGTLLERWHGVSIVVEDLETLDYRFIGTFEKQTFEQAIDGIR